MTTIPDLGELEALPTYDRCFCCGAGNDCGLRLTFGARGGEAWTFWTPEARHGGYPGRAHGGATGAVLDEAMGWGAYLGSRLMVVTAELRVRFLAEVEVGRPFAVRAWLGRNQRGRILHAEGQLMDLDGRVRVRASGRFMPLARADAVAMVARLEDEGFRSLPIDNA